MFEFSFVSVIGAILLGAVVWHFFSKQIMGWVTPKEAALMAQLAVLEHRLGITETALNPPTAAPVVPVAVVPPAAPAAASAAAPVAKA